MTYINYNNKIQMTDGHSLLSPILLIGVLMAKIANKEEKRNTIALVSIKLFSEKGFQKKKQA